MLLDQRDNAAKGSDQKAVEAKNGITEQIEIDSLIVYSISISSISISSSSKQSKHIMLGEYNFTHWPEQQQ